MRALLKWLRGKPGPAAPGLPAVTDITGLQGKRVLVRASLNVPIKDGRVADPFRIEQSLPTIKYLQDQGARVIVTGHIGREGESLAPVFDVLKQKIDISWGGELAGVSAAAAALQDGQALLLENLRRDPRESGNDDSLAKELAALADCYVNDAFADSHRAHASIVGVPKRIPGYFGFGFLGEYRALSAALTPTSPSIFFLGGAKFETKLPLVLKFARKYDHVFVGGALANDIFKARGLPVGRSMISAIDLAGNELLNQANLIVPEDVIIETTTGERRAVAPDAVGPEDIISDAGPKTIERLAPLTATAVSILWNGPLGNYEKGFTEGTEKLAKLIAESSGHSIVGGGDTVASIERLGLSDQFDFLSSAGGAMLVFLETGTLPAIDAVLRR